MYFHSGFQVQEYLLVKSGENEFPCVVSIHKIRHTLCFIVTCYNFPVDFCFVCFQNMY